MYKTDNVWYVALVCVPVYVITLPLVLMILGFLTCVSLASDFGLWDGGREWAYRRIDSLVHIMP